MGGVSQSGSDKSDDRKVDTYADQLKKIQAKKSKYKINKFGYKVKKTAFERYKEVNPVTQIITAVAGQHNLNRRMKFANKHGINIQGLSTTEILSKDFKSKLDKKGYSVEPGNVGRKNDGGNNNQQIAEKSKVESQMTAGVATNTGTVIAPTNAEISQASSTTMSADEILLANKKKGRSQTILNTSSGLGSSNTLNLKKKTLGV